MKRPRILFVRERFPWMGGHSGYDQACAFAADEFAGTVASVFRVRREPRGPAAFLLWKILRLRSHSRLYNGSSARAEWQTWTRQWTFRPDLVHIMYLEEQLGLLGHWPAPRNRKLVATLHQPVTWLQQHGFSAEWVRGLDLVITVSRAQAALVDSFASVPARTIRHGVDTDFFRPAATPPEIKAGLQLLSVGSWLRDFNVIEKVVGHCAITLPTIRFTFVIPPHARTQPVIERLTRQPNTRFLEGLSNEDLRTAYQQADALFLPLLDSTANNAVLEAMACGLPVLSTAIGGGPDYVPEGGGVLYEPGSDERVLRDLAEWVRNPEPLHEMGAHARRVVEAELAWPIVRRRQLEAYAQLLSRSP